MAETKKEVKYLDWSVENMKEKPVKDAPLVEALLTEIEFIPPRLFYRNIHSVEAYLARYPEIKEFIKTAWPALVKYFEEPVDIVLEVMTDPDQPGSETMVGWIQSTDDVLEGLKKFERFEDQWFLDHMAEMDDKFNFNIETK